MGVSQEDEQNLDETIKNITLNTTSNGGLDKPSMITVMKLIGDFSKKK